MTQIVALATPELVVVAADRRLTYPDGSVADDESTKLILFGGRLLIAYTGLARIGHVPTAEWLSGFLAEYELASEALPMLTDALNRRWQSLLGVVDERLTIVGVGAAHFDGQPRTYAMELANHGLGQNGVGEFRLEMQSVEPGAGMTCVAGQSMTADRRQQMMDEMIAAGDSLEGVVTAIARAMGDTALTNDRVGKDLLVAISSQQTLLSARMAVMSGGSPFDVHISAFLPDGDVGDTRWHSMYLAGGGSVLIGAGGEAGDLPNGPPLTFDQSPAASAGEDDQNQTASLTARHPGANALRDDSG